MIYTRKQEEFYRDKVNSSLVSIYNCKMGCSTISCYHKSVRFLPSPTTLHSLSDLTQPFPNPHLPPILSFTTLLGATYSVLRLPTICLYRAFSLTWPASMLIYWSKRKHLHEKSVKLPGDFLGKPTWPPFHCFEDQYGRRDVM